MAAVVVVVVMVEGRGEVRGLVRHLQGPLGADGLRNTLPAGSLPVPAQSYLRPQVWASGCSPGDRSGPQNDSYGQVWSYGATTRWVYGAAGVMMCYAGPRETISKTFYC
ncbi:hypothetical protein E2C01_061218 [Portunus trituberculatus]|uniref:Uncharacterized protein n=1 Tax=Portunus trituberculatus TaxID=210409 RepID=A0A5B7HEF8_PORTR|nr:hypothetical protein [Portunus trituberculatus]